MPLVGLDGKPVEGIVEIEEYNVKSIRVLKGKPATDLYGEKASGGVVIIESKQGTPPLQ